MNREQAARKNHHSGYSCSSAVYRAFSDLVQGDAPTPRSEGGKCGAVLAGEKVLKELGLDSSSFDAQFLARFHSLKCGDLRRAGFLCNDLVGAATRMAEEGIGH